MTTVLAGVDPHGDRRVAEVARALAEMLHGDVRRVYLTHAEHREHDVQRLLAELAAPEVTLAALPDTDRTELVWPLVQQTGKPVVIVPAGARQGGEAVLSRVLLPLDGSAESAHAVAETIELLARAGVTLIVLHVFDETTVPRYWDHPEHAERIWREEFLARYCDLPGVQLQWRSGVPAEQVVDVALHEKVDLIALGWSQHLDPGRARIVRRTVQRAHVPVLLVPIATEP